MRTLIVPCAGTRTIDGLPLFLNRYPDGKIIAVKAIEGVFADNYDRIIYTVLKESVDRYNAVEEIKKHACGYDVEFVVLDKQTNGPAETVHKTIMAANVTGEFAVRDSHAFIATKKDYVGNFVAGLDLTQYDKPIDNLRSKSFITINEQGQVLDIVEKHFSSDIISAGMYGFKSTDDFVFAYEHLIDPNYGIKKLYLSHVISYLIGYSQRVFHRARVTRFEDWSTKAAWQKVQRLHSLVFVNLDTISKKEIDKIKEIKDNGGTIIGFSSESEIDTLWLNSELFKMIINDCPQSKSRIVLSNNIELEDFMVGM